MNIIQLSRRQILNNIITVEIDRVVDTRVSSTTIISVPVHAALVDGRVLYITYGDWDIVWSLYDISIPTIKGVKYSKPLIDMIIRELTPIKEELMERYNNIKHNQILLGGKVV